MELHGPDYVYECCPPVLGNEITEQIRVYLKGIPNRALKEAAVEQQSLAPIKAMEANEAFIAKYVTKVEGTIDGRELKTYGDLCAYAPLEFSRWVDMAVVNTAWLSAAERKNLSGGSGTASTSQPTPRSSAKTATKKSAK